MPIIIDVKLKQSPAMNAMARLNQAISAVNKNAQALNATLAQTATLAQAVGQAMGSSRGGGRGVSGGSRAMAKPPVDPWTRYVNNRLQNQAFRAQFQQQYGKKSNPVLNAVMSSRLGFSANGQFSVMPLVSSLAKLGTGFAMAASAVTVWAVAISTATSAIDKWTQSMIMGGGSPGQAAAASAVGNALGLGPQGLADIGKGLSEGLGPIIAGKVGVNPFGGPFGDNNYNNKALKIADYINSQYSGRGQAGLEAARRDAELAGSPGLANAALIDKKTYAKLRQVQGGSFEDSQNMANFKAEWEILTTKAQVFAVKYVRPLLKYVADVIDTLTTMFDWLTKFFEGLPEWVKAVVAPNYDSGNGGKRESALDKNTRAIKENTDQMKEGQYGGGARSGVPSKMNPGFGGANWGQRDVAYGIL